MLINTNELSTLTRHCEVAGGDRSNLRWAQGKFREAISWEFEGLRRRSTPRNDTIHHLCINNRGFTLIELIITIIVVSIGVLGLIAALSFSTSRGINSELVTTSTTLAQERLEQLIAEKRANGYSSAVLAIGTTTDPPFAAPYADYSRTVEICYVDSDLLNPDCDPAAPNVNTGFKRVTVTVTNTRLPAESTVQAVTLVTDY